ncbi:hypothetical protein Tco_0464657 [Tanacetum coccineum]
MATENVQASSTTTAATSAAAPRPAVNSCRKKRSGDASFIQDVRNHIDEFIHASMDEHKTCLKNTISKLFSSMSKVVTEKDAAEKKGVESSLPLQTVVTD